MIWVGDNTGGDLSPEEWEALRRAFRYGALRKTLDDLPPDDAALFERYSRCDGELVTPFGTLVFS